MYPLNDYSTLIDYLKSYHYRSAYVFVILSKAESRNSELYGFFEKNRYNYLHVRSGKEVFFFIPGYEHNTNRIEISGKQFNPMKFAKTVNEFEKELYNYHYYGGIEMLLIKYDHVRCAFDPKEYSAFKLNYFVEKYGKDNGWSRIDRFFEDAIYYAKNGRFFEDIKRDINHSYENLLCLQESKILKPQDINKNNYVFISYSFSDEDRLMNNLRQAFKEANIDFWDAKIDIPSGSDYAAAIVTAIKSCSKVLLVLSKNSMTSNHIIKELSIAINEKKQIQVITLSDYSDFEENDSLYYYLADIEVKKDNADTLDVQQLKHLISNISE